MSDCKSCAIIGGDDRAVVVHEDAEAMALLDHRPLFHGQTPLVPKLHVQVLSELPHERVEHFFLMATRAERRADQPSTARRGSPRSNPPHRAPTGPLGA